MAKTTPEQEELLALTEAIYRTGFWYLVRLGKALLAKQREANDRDLRTMTGALGSCLKTNGG